MSERWLPGAACSMPAASAAWPDVEQPLRLVGDLADRERVRGVADEAAERDADVDREDVALARARTGPGMPCTTIAFGDVQIDAG